MPRSANRRQVGIPSNLYEMPPSMRRARATALSSILRATHVDVAVVPRVFGGLTPRPDKTPGPTPRAHQTPSISGG